MKTACNVFPKNPFEIDDAMGVKARLSIESEAFWVESESGEKERIFFSELNENCSLEIPGYSDQDFALLLHSSNRKRSFDYIPKQFLLLTGEV
jgi:hypothetical protein